MNNNSKKILLWSLLPLIPVTILTIISGIDIFPFPDTAEYVALSRNLAKDFTFVSDNTYLCRRTPGYPFLIMLFSFLGGYGFLAVNLIALFGISFFGVKLADKYSIRNSWLIPVMVCLSPGLITLASVPLTEIIFVFFLILSIYLVVNDRFLYSGLALSAATFCRPAGIFLFLLFTGWMLWKRKKILLVLLFVAGANLFPAFWTARNYIKYGYPVYTNLSNFYLLYYKAGSFLSWRNNVSFDDTRNELSMKITGNDIFEQSKSAGKLGREIILDNFWEFCLWAPRDTINFLMPDITPMLERLQITSGNRGTLDILRRKGLQTTFTHYFNNNTAAITVTFIYLAFYCFLMAATAFGTIRLFMERHYSKLIFGAMLTLYFWILPIGNLDWRFRMPIMPFLFILAVYGINALLKIIHDMKENKVINKK